MLIPWFSPGENRGNRRKRKVNKQILILAVTVIFLIAGSIHLYSQNSKLNRNIALAAEQCEQKVAELEARYQAEIDDLRRYILARYKTDAESKPETKPRFDQLVSHDHRVQAVGQKYDFLLETALIGKAEKKELLRLLTERERLANLINIAKSGPDSAGAGPQRLQTDLDNVESQIQVLLQDPLDYQRYEVLRQRKL